MVENIDHSLRAFLIDAAKALGGLDAIVTVGLQLLSTDDNSAPYKRLGMVIDLRRCTGCRACTVACKAENDVPLGYFRTWVKLTEVNIKAAAGAGVRRQFLPIFCNHCENPTCIPACSPQALQKRPDGLVFINKTVCDGCGECVNACPYQAIYLDPQSGLADKCNLCEHRLQEDRPTACEQTCVGGAIYVGDLNDPDSRPSRYLKSLPPGTAVRQLKAETGNNPSIFYIDPENRVASASVGGIQRLEYAHPKNYRKDSVHLKDWVQGINESTPTKIEPGRARKAKKGK